MAMRIKFTESGETLEWTGEHESILEFAESNGLWLQFGCREGNCQSCMVRMPKGKTIYNHQPGTDVDGGCTLTCITTPDPESGDLELEA